MKKALISTIESYQFFNGSKGFRVAQVENVGNEFAVAEGLYWINCDDSIEADRFYFDEKTQSILPIPEQSKPQQPTTNGTQTL